MLTQIGKASIIVPSCFGPMIFFILSIFSFQFHPLNILLALFIVFMY